MEKGDGNGSHTVGRDHQKECFRTEWNVIRKFGKRNMGNKQKGDKDIKEKLAECGAKEPKRMFGLEGKNHFY